LQCLESEFGCSDGSCISLKKRCDGVADCDDKFDEKKCEIVIIDQNIYQKEQPPLNKETHQTKVSVDMTVISVDNFDEIQMSFSAKFTVELQWCVSFLSYNNNDIMTFFLYILFIST
jgi:hypothetical protein